MSETVHDLCCPGCLTAGKENPLRTRQGKFAYFCSEGHEYVTDNDGGVGTPLPKDLKRMTVAPPKPKTIDPNVTEIKLEIPVFVRDQLNSRFGEKTRASVGAVLRAMCDESAFIVGGADCKRLAELFGKKVGDGNTLIGLIFNLKADLTQAEERAKIAAVGQPANVQGGGLGQVVISDFSSDTLERLASIARFRGQTIPDVIKNAIIMGLDSGAV